MCEYKFAHAETHTHRLLALFNPLPVLPLSLLPAPNTLLDMKHGASVCCRWMLMCHIHLFVSLIWIFACFQPCTYPSHSTFSSKPLMLTFSLLLLPPFRPCSCRWDIRAPVLLDRSQSLHGQGGVRDRRPFLSLCRLALFWLKDSCIFHFSPLWRRERRR